MNLYRLLLAKDVFVRHFEPNDRKDIAKMFTINHIFDTMHAQNFYMNKNFAASILIDEDTLQKIHLSARVKFGRSFELSDFYKKSEPFEASVHDHFKVKNATEVIDHIKEHTKKDYVQKIIKLKKDASKIASRNREIVHRNMIRKMDKDIYSKKVVAIDFEYFNMDAFEFGIATYDKGMTSHAHFLVEENYKNKKTSPDLQFKFNFGETSIIREEKIPEIVAHFLDKADVLVLHSYCNDYLLLCKYGLDLDSHPTLKMADTSFFYSKNFADSLSEEKTLKKILHSFEIDCTNMHNSGNDAAYTLQLFMKMHEIELSKKKALKMVV